LFLEPREEALFSWSPCQLPPLGTLRDSFGRRFRGGGIRCWLVRGGRGGGSGAGWGGGGGVGGVPSLSLSPIVPSLLLSLNPLFPSFCVVLCLFELPLFSSSLTTDNVFPTLSSPPSETTYIRLSCIEEQFLLFRFWVLSPPRFTNLILIVPPFGYIHPWDLHPTFFFFYVLPSVTLPLLTLFFLTVSF